MTRWPIAIALVAGGAFFAGRAWPSPAPAAVACPAPLAPAGVAVVASLDRALLRSEIRAALREATATPLVPGPGPGPGTDARPVAVSVAPPSPTVEQAAAFDRGQSLIAAGQHARRWTREDALELRRVMAQLGDDERDVLVRALVPAVNRGELTVEIAGPLF